MGDKLQSDGMQLPQGSSESTMADPGGEREKKITSVGPLQRGTDAAIKAVHDRLSAKKAVFRTPAAIGSSTLPSITAIGNIVDRLKASPDTQAKPDQVQTSIGALAMQLPQEIEADRTKDVDTSSGEPPRDGMPKGSHHSPDLGSIRGSTSINSTAPTTSQQVSESKASVGGISDGSNRTDGENRTDHRIGATISRVLESQGPPDTPSIRDNREPADHRISASDLPSHLGPAPLEARAGEENPIRSEANLATGDPHENQYSSSGETKSPADASMRSVHLKAATVDLPQESKGVTTLSRSRPSIGIKEAGVGVSSPPSEVDSRTDSTAHAEPSMNFVRSPLSADLRNHSMASPSLPEGGAPPDGQGGSGRSPAEDRFDTTSSSHEGASIDLSKTNELLQQLVDAVRNQGGSFLPTGSPSVYPGR
jgi:hypothetical protein